MPKIVQTAATALLFGLSLAAPAVASEICDQLSFKLATLSEQDAPGDQAQKYATAIAEQQKSLDDLALTMRKTGCSSGSMMVIGGPNAGECSHLESKKTRMERNLEILESKRISLIADDSGTRTREKLVAALTENRCNEQPLLVSTPGEDGTEPLVRDDPNGFETIRVPSAEPDYNDRQFVDLGGASMNGSYRTMCVRTCDGAYFPVSSHASPTNFSRDAQVCSMMCPGTETELYYHSIQSESSDMRSTSTGRPYDELENAYRFRTEKPGSKPQCSCNFALYYKEMMRRQSYVADPASIPSKQSSIVWLKPELRTTLKKADEVAALVPKPKERAYVPDSRIRIVGPTFLPDNGIDFTKSAANAAK